MAKSKATFSKREREKKRRKKKEEKARKREERKANAAESGSSLEDMIAYVDEYGNITDTPPDPKRKKKIKAEHIEISVPKKEDWDEPTEFRGRVEFFNDEKGFGFIKSLDSHEKYFFHVSGLIDEVYENDIVNFELERGQRGMNAVRVKKEEKK